MSENNENVWEASEKIKVILPDGSIVERECIDPKGLMAIAREAGIKKFTAEKDGVLLTPATFTVLEEGTVFIKDYNSVR